jgi:hypothetical protein
MGVLLVLALGAAAPAEAQGKVVLGRDIYFRGGTIELGLGKHALRERAFEAEASAIDVPAGVTVTLRDMQGVDTDTCFCLRLDGPTRIDDLKRAKPGGQDWNDRISSITVCRSDDHRCITPLFYKDVHFRGRCEEFWNTYELESWRIFNDQMSSFIVPPGWTVTLYQHADFKGISVEMKGPARIEDMKNGPRDDLRRLHDKVSSIKVKAP